LLLKKAETEEELEEIYSLRYKAYCLEKNFEPKELFPNFTEKNEYDCHSIHLVVKVQNHVIGTARLVLNSPIGFPLEKYCQLNFSGLGINKNQTAEVSRFTINKDLFKKIDCDRQKVLLVLFRGLYQESKKLGINYLCASMQRGFQKMLAKSGILFLQAGPLVEYHGVRAPYVSGIRLIEEGILLKDPDLYRFITRFSLFCTSSDINHPLGSEYPGIESMANSKS
jgi:N-acyl-L-homoserine lactone synthetase